MIFQGDVIKLVKSIPGFDKVGDSYQVESIISGEMDMIQFRCSYGMGLISCDGFHDFFTKVRTHPWSDWENVLIGNNVYQYRTNGKRVVLKLGGIKASASCHPLDYFNLEQGIKICAERIAAKKELST